MDKEKQICKHFDEEVCSKLDCKKDCKYYGKANCHNCIHEEICQLRTFSYCEEEVKEKGCEHYQQKFSEDSVVVSKKEIKIYQQIYDLMEEKGIVSVNEMKTLVNFALKTSMLKAHIVKETAEKWHYHITTTLLALWKGNKITTEVYNSWISFFNGLAKQFGVEVK